MKVKVLQGLKTKYKNLGLSEKALDGVADILSKNITEESQVDEAVTDAEGLCKLVQSEADRERGEKAKLQAKLDELSREPTKGSTPPNGDDTPEWFKEWQTSKSKELEALKEQIATMQTGSKSKARQDQLDEVLKGAPESFANVARGSFSLVKEVDDEAFDAWLSSVQEEGKKETAKANTYTPNSGSRTNETDKPSKEDVDKALSQLKGE